MGSLKTSVNSKERVELLKKGTVISVKHESVFEPVLSVIQEADNEHIYFRLPESFINNNAFKGDKIIIQILQRDYEYVIGGTIGDIEIQYPKLIQVFIDNINKYKNNRKEKRYLVNFQAHIFTNDKQKEKIYAIVKNISMNGVGIVLKDEIDTSKLKNIKVLIAINNNAFLQFTAKFVRSINRSRISEYGLQISEIDDFNKDTLDKLIFYLEKNEAFFIEDNLK